MASSVARDASAHACHSGAGQHGSHARWCRRARGAAPARGVGPALQRGGRGQSGREGPSARRVAARAGEMLDSAPVSDAGRAENLQFSSLSVVGNERIEVIGVDGWQKWCALFEDMDDRDRRLEALDAQLSQAIEEENYSYAARTRADILQLESQDPAMQIEQRLQAALDQEDYEEAARVRDDGLVHLVGWWAGVGEQGDFHGHLLRIFCRYGRYFGVAYSARDIADSMGWRNPLTASAMQASDIAPTSIDSLGMPVLEIFLQPDADGGFVKKAAYLMPVPPAAGTNAEQEGSADGDGRGSPASAIDEELDPVSASWRRVMESRAGQRSGAADAEAFEDRLSDMYRELERVAPVDMERVPAVVELVGRDRFTVDVQLAEAAHLFQRSMDDMIGEEQRVTSSVPLVFGGAEGRRPRDYQLGSRGDAAPAKDGAPPAPSSAPSRMDMAEGSEGVRISIELSDEDLRRVGLSASALQHISGGLSQAIAAKVQHEMQVMGEGKELSEERVAELVSETVAEVAEKYKWGAALGPDGAALSVAPQPESAQGTEAPPALVGALQEAAAPAPARTVYRKLRPELSVPSDPYSGLYLGTFGPHGPELLLLQRGVDEEGDECVTATKVTGDAHVPAGQVSFQAKVGRKARLEARGVYPDQLGIVGRFKGRGRIANVGYKEPQWTEGELVQFGAAAQRDVTSGAELGFLWSINQKRGTQRFLILLNRVNLDLEKAFY